MKDILICVDDEPHILKALERMLRKETFEIRTTTDAKQALEWIKTLPVKACISDYRMEQMTGIEVLKNVKEINPEVGRIILSGYSDQSLIDRALKTGDVHDYVLKPFDMEKFKFFLRRFFIKPEKWEDV